MEPVVNVLPEMPKDYHAIDAKYSSPFLGELRAPDGSYYSKFERRKYCDDDRFKVKHCNKTPLHIARYAVQYFSQIGDLVFDPFTGSGTTGVEALRNLRNFIGTEIDPDYVNIAKHNCEINNIHGCKFAMLNMDARKIGEILKMKRLSIDLVITNPPYSGDENQGKTTKNVYNKDLANLAFLKEKNEYYETMQDIFSNIIGSLKIGGHFIIGVKDMMRNKEYYLLHEKLSDLLANIGLRYVGLALLKHYPTTYFINTYHKRTGIMPPLYQSITVFKKEK